jgi:hypothetical protein
VFHYVYKIENLANGKVYVGKHSTEKLDDGYMGSGKLITRAIAKYGIENFRKHIVKMCETSEEAFDLEQKIVNEQFVLDENTYNITLGGRSVFLVKNTDAYERAYGIEIQRRRQAKGQETMRRLRKEDVFWKKKESLQRSAEMQHRKMNGSLKILGIWQDKKHKKETREKMSLTHQRNAHQRGKKNSQFDTMWVFNDDLKKTRKIHKNEFDEFKSKVG